jgi:hypothetical protein
MVFNRLFSLQNLSAARHLFLYLYHYLFSFLAEYGFIKPVDRSEQIYFRVEDFRDLELSQIHEVSY